MTDLDLDQVRARFREYAEASADSGPEQLAAQRCANDIPSLLNRIAELAAEVARLRGEGGTSRTEYAVRVDFPDTEKPSLYYGKSDDPAKSALSAELAGYVDGRGWVDGRLRVALVTRTVTRWPDGSGHTSPWTEVAP